MSLEDDYLNRFYAPPTQAYARHTSPQLRNEQRHYPHQSSPPFQAEIPNNLPINYEDEQSSPTNSLIDRSLTQSRQTRPMLLTCLVWRYIVFLCLLVAWHWVLYFFLPYWYRYCYSYVGPLSAWAGFSHWHSDDTIAQLKDKVWTDFVHSDDMTKTDEIASCLAYYCPNFWHYLKHEISQAGEVSNAFSGLYVFTALALAVTLMLAWTCQRRSLKVKKALLIGLAVGFILLPLLNILAFVTFVGIGKWDSFGKVTKAIPYNSRCWFDGQDESNANSREDADSPNNVDFFAAGWAAIPFMLLNIIFSIRGILQVQQTWKSFVQVNQKMWKVMRSFGALSAAIQSRINSKLQPAVCDVISRTGDDAHLTIIVVSDAFEGKKLLARQRVVNSQLTEFWSQGLHATSIVAKTPEEWEKADKSQFY